MSKPILKFRCYRCAKLLGVSPSKAGRATTCPNCQAELIVPEPDEAVEEVPEIAIDPGPESIAPASAPPRRGVSGDPGFSWEEIDASLFRTIAEHIEEPPTESTFPPPPPLPEGRTTETSGASSSVLDVRVEPPEIATIRSPRRDAASGAKLSEAVLLSLSLFAIVAIALAFVVGLFVGHYAWK